ncbi:MAG: sulfotransferase [Planctomycetota bacterium]
MKLSSLARRVLARTSSSVGAVFATPQEAPVFVLGHQKSGTTAIASLISACSGLRLTGDFFYQERYEDVARYLEGATPLDEIVRRHRQAFSRPIIKDPDLTFFYDGLRDFFPAARFVFVVRDPRQNLRSILNRLNIAGTDGDLTAHGDLREELPAWWSLLTGRAPRVDSRNHVEALAKRWSLAAEVYLRDPDRMRLVRYEDFVRDKPATIAEVCRGVGLDPRHDISGVMDRQYQPAGQRGVDAQEFFGPDNLRLIEECCRDQMGAFGYETRSAEAPTGRPHARPDETPR